MRMDYIWVCSHSEGLVLVLLCNDITVCVLADNEPNTIKSTVDVFTRKVYFKSSSSNVVATIHGSVKMRYC